jgi:hypothetical protein
MNIQPAFGSGNFPEFKGIQKSWLGGGGGGGAPPPAGHCVAEYEW